MWEKVRSSPVYRDHSVYIPFKSRPGDWFDHGDAKLAPLYRKRGHLRIEQWRWLYAWTLYNEALGCADWVTPLSENASLHFKIRVINRNPTGWYFTVPEEMRDRGWLPSAGELIVWEFTRTEMNFWTEAAYNLEAKLEADQRSG